eukprot:scaffold246_cov177-Chaetoceros_neogracile.AAC.3
MANIDTSLAPYVTSILRAALSNLSDTDISSLSSSLSRKIQTLAEYEALMELLMEQCEMESNNADSALTSIAKAIHTGEFQDFENRHRSLSLSMNTRTMHRSSFSSTLVGNGVMSCRGFGGANNHSMGKFRSKSMGAENDYYCKDDLLGDLLKENMECADDGVSSDSPIGAGMGKMRQRDSLDSTMTNNSTLPDWSVANRQDSPDQVGVGNAIEEEPSFFLEEDEETPVKTPLNGINSSGDTGSGCNLAPAENFLMSGLSPFLTDEEKKVAEGLKNLPAPTFSFTPLKQDQLIPIDLLGVIDDPSTPANDLSTQKLSSGDSGATDLADGEAKDNDSAPCEYEEDKKTLSTVTAEAEHTPMKNMDDKKDFVKRIALDTIMSPLLVRAQSNILERLPSASGLNPQSKLNLSGKGKKGYKKDNDLATTLFSRPRSRSISYDERSPKLKPMAPPSASKIGMAGLTNCSADALMTNSIPALFQKQLDSAVEILLAMNYDVCRDASYEAALVSNADVNVAQHVIDGVLSAPPVCRHMLNDGCYRSDCHFSHDVDGHTCLFWLRGRCGKGNSCRFMHGFSEKLLDGVDIDFRNAPQGRGEEPSTYVLPPAQSTPTKPIAIKTGNLVHHNIKAIASKGYSKQSSFNKSKATTEQSGIGKALVENKKIVRIPQNLWTASQNRASGAFHISDPIARYKEVSTTVQRADVLDLHFQSVKTFPAVLSNILPGKLKEHGEIWIVTGSGHHVSRSSHQKGGGVLENAVIGWLAFNDYNYSRGKDKNNFGGAVLVHGR